MLRTGFLIVLFVGIAGCLAPPSLVPVPGSGARVSGHELAELVARHESAVIGMLGTQWERPYVVLDTQRNLGHYAITRSWDRRVMINVGRARGVNFPVTLVHELAHVHMRDHWEQLPPVLQEGVAYWVALRVLKLPVVLPPPPTAAQRLKVLTMSYSDYVSSENVNELNEVATKMAAELFQDADEPETGDAHTDRAGASTRSQR